MRESFNSSFRYQLLDLLKTMVIYFACCIAMVALVVIFGSGQSRISGMSLTIFVFSFVVGVVNVRVQSRLSAQMGVSRSTTYIAQLAAVVLSGLAGMLGIEILDMLTGLLVSGANATAFSSLYKMIYLDGRSIGPADRLMNILMGTCFYVNAYYSGAWISAMFWRLKKLGTFIVVAALVIGINLFFYVMTVVEVKTGLASRILNAYVEAAAESTGPIFALLIGLTLVYMAINWLLLRKAYIKPGK